MSFVLTIARTTLLEAYRSRLIWLVVAVLALSLGLAAFLQQLAIIEARQIQGAIIAALLRACAAFLVISTVVISMVREFNDKVLDLVLSQPMPRSSYLLGKFVGFSTIAVAIAIAFSLPLAFLVPPERIPAWTFSLGCELVILTAMSLFCVITLTHVIAALAVVFGFYILARSIAAIQIMAAGAEASQNLLDRAGDWLIRGTALLLPRFDLMTQTAWLVDATPAALGLGMIAGQTAIYLMLIVGAALFDLQRQNF